MPKTLYETIIDRVRSQLPALILFSCLVNLLLLVTVLYMLQVYDRVLSTDSLDTLIWLTLGTLAAIIVYGLIEHARRLMLTRTGAWLNLELTGPVIRRAMEARLAGAGLEAGPRDVSDLRAFFDGDGPLALLDAPWAVDLHRLHLAAPPCPGPHRHRWCAGAVRPRRRQRLRHSARAEAHDGGAACQP